jgi:uncharacterized protein (UPF0333 family)
MKLHNNSIAALAAVLAFGLATPYPAAADVTEAQVAAAKTPADHEAIAKSYEAEAATAEVTASKHEAMARTYRAAGGPKKTSTNSMVRHCERLVKAYTDAAADYRALAAEHRSVAKDTAQ